MLGMSRTRPLLEEHTADKAALLRLHSVEGSPHRIERMLMLGVEYQEWLLGLDWQALEPDERADAQILRHGLMRDRLHWEAERDLFAELTPIIPFARAVGELEEARKRFDWAAPSEAACRLHALVGEVGDATDALEQALEHRRHLVDQVVKQANRAKDLLTTWHTFYAGYHPEFDWWTKAPYDQLIQALDHFIERAKAHQKPGEVYGRPVGREIIERALLAHCIPYSPEELIKLGEQEFEWCQAELRKAAHDMGLEGDARAALERVKNLHEEPGRQPELVRHLAVEAIEYLKANDLLTVPPVAEETWRMEMMPAERQKVAPFFLGGETILVSFPTDTMDHDLKLMSLRGNNRHFARATVHHELIPGHHLQFFSMQRNHPHRTPYHCCFWTEGWALYWEMLLWDLGFPRSPEDRVGMLFWRSHRAARVSFSLKFHLGQMSAAECVDMLVDQVGHERSTAEGEVRRSFGGDYEPLYQAAYFIGGLQMRALAQEYEHMKGTRKRFHDSVMGQNTMPIEVLRARLLDLPLEPEHRAAWRFAE